MSEPGHQLNIRRVLDRVAQTARLMVGVGDYEAYLHHMRQRHPDHPPMSREAFVRRAVEARFGGGGIKRCPC